MQRLYDLGARRVLVTGTGPLGCVPAELALRGRNGECSAELNRAAALYNPQLVEMINQLNSEIGSEVFVSANAFDMHMDFISDPQAYGTSTSIYNLFFHKKKEVIIRSMELSIPRIILKIQICQVSQTSKY